MTAVIFAGGKGSGTTVYRCKWGDTEVYIWVVQCSGSIWRWKESQDAAAISASRVKTRSRERSVRTFLWIMP